jgi:hypothetical protein
MQSLQNPKYITEQLKLLVESNKRSEIRLNANGGNSILVTCPPLKEQDYINVFEATLSKSNFKIIDLNELLISFLDINKAEIEELFELLSGSIPQIFKSSDGEEDTDFFAFVMQQIKSSIDENKIPILIRTGTLYGSGIDNIHLMEHQTVMRAAVPLIILYPAVQENDTILFLSTRPASKYRCMILN